MTDQTYRFPTAAELDEIQRRARRMQGEAMRDAFKAAVKWLAHPSLGWRHA